jgi:hypothetical protein
MEGLRARRNYLEVYLYESDTSRDFCTVSHAEMIGRPRAPSLRQNLICDTRKALLTFITEALQDSRAAAGSGWRRLFHHPFAASCIGLN